MLLCGPCQLFVKCGQWVLELSRQPEVASIVSTQLIALSQLRHFLYGAGVHPCPIEEVAQLAQRYQLSAYDACYLWLAAELKYPLATFDEQLARAAQEHLASLG